MNLARGRSMSSWILKLSVREMEEEISAIPRRVASSLRGGGRPMRVVRL